MILESNYQQYASQDEVRIEEGKGGFPYMFIDNKYASACICAYGAQVLSYKLKQTNEESHDLLYLSESAYFEVGKAIRGGIPICWPWFGRDTENLGREIHGFARKMLWQLEETESLADGATKITLTLSESEDTLKLWPHNFKLTLTVIISKSLGLSLQTHNTSETPFTITQALHAYFSIADINQTKVEGLDGVYYSDKVKGQEKTVMQDGDIKVAQEVDRIYNDAPTQTNIIDLTTKTEIGIKTKGSKTTVVWNPWINISKQFSDLNDDAYLRFICVETANAADDIVVIEPDES